MLPSSAIAAILALQVSAFDQSTTLAATHDTGSPASAAQMVAPEWRLPIRTPGLGRDSLTLGGSNVSPVRDGRAQTHRDSAVLAIRAAHFRLLHAADTTMQDTLPRARRKAFVISEGYEKRLFIHKTISWTMLPLFAASYFSGDQLFSRGSSAPQWARSLHRPAATGAAVLFSANLVTGTWNLWESRHNPNGRKRRFVHAALFTAASAGFTYSGLKLADEAEQSRVKRDQHRNLSLVSMGVSTFSWLIMLVGN